MSLVEVKVPDIGDFKDVDVIEVNIKPGDVIENEQALLTLESDKASIEVPSDTAGTVKEVRVKTGDKVSQGTVIAVVESSAEAAPAKAAKEPEKAPAQAEAKPQAAPAPAPAAAAPATGAVAAKVNGQLSGKLGELGLTPQQVEGVLALSREVVERVVWEVVPALAEALIKEEIARLMKA